MNKILFSGLVVSLCVHLGMGTLTHAQSAEPVFDSATLREAASAFQFVSTVSAPDTVVPTVVSVPIDSNREEFEGRQFLVVEDVRGTYIGSQFISSSNIVDPVLSARAEPATASTFRLVDNNFSTTVDFLVDGENANRVTLTLESDGQTPITATTFDLALAPHVSLPLTVAIEAEVSGAFRTVLSETQMRGRTINFPETTAHTWRVTFTYIQPLRIAEVSLRPSVVDAVQAHELRFLSQPGQSYRVYTAPDRTVVLPRVETGNLRDNEGIVAGELVLVERNPLYEPADVDGDGVVDTQDNCVTHPNPEQIDQNRNGKGDVCEDFDRDGVINSLDNCPDIANRNQADEDGDGIGDACDEEESRFTERYIWVPWVGMGIAAIVILSLFVLVGRRPEDDADDHAEAEDQA